MRRAVRAGLVGFVLALGVATGVVAAGPQVTARRAAAPGTAAVLRVTHQARAIAPGEVVLLTVTSPGGLSEVRGRAFGQALVGYPGAAPDTWHALAGIALETKPGPAFVTIDAKKADGTPVRSRYRLTVAPKTFPTRRLSVAPGFVTPPAAELPRIERERAEVSRIFSAVSPRPLWGTGFDRPVGGAVISAFGARSIFNRQARAPHRGIDFRGAAGTPVAAPADGVVVLAKDLYFSGTTVILDHGLGVFSMLCHLSRLDVRPDDAVVRGAAIGAIGATGRVTGPHLHWTVRVGPVSVDPLSLLAVAGPPR
jgi:murein DD-endopeptidase MepM/ murein hydrolase activator NlpD